MTANERKVRLNVAIEVCEEVCKDLIIHKRMSDGFWEEMNQLNQIISQLRNFAADLNAPDTAWNSCLE